MKRSNKRLMTTLIGIKREANARKQAMKDISDDNLAVSLFNYEHAIREFNLVSETTKSSFNLILQGKEYNMDT